MSRSMRKPTDHPESGNFFIARIREEIEGNLVLELSTDLIGGKAESGHDVGQGIVLLENLEVYALGTKFKAGVRVFGKKGRKAFANPVMFSRARLSQSYPEKNQLGSSADSSVFRRISSWKSS